MTFSLPPFSLLSTDTRNLDIIYSIFLGRYDIAPQIESSSSSQATTDQSKRLETLIARTHCVIKCDSDRASAKEVFNLLTQECRDILHEHVDDKIKQAVSILLGGLFHRYFRLLKEYDRSNSYTSYFWTPYDEKNCKLFTAIRQALNLPAEMPKDYRKKDLAVLDPATVVTSLNAFRDHMKLNDNYLKYPHLRDDPNFETNLEVIIQEHTVRDSGVIHQFKAINFLQSLLKHVELVFKQAEEALVKWCEKLAKDHGDFSKLNIQIIEAHLIENIDDVSTREYILDLLYAPKIVDNITKLDHPEFLSELKKCNSGLASHFVVGGYGLLLQTKLVTEHLSFYMRQALGLMNKPSSSDAKPATFTDEDALNGIKFLKQFLSNNPAAALDCEFFGGKSQMNTLILQYELALTKKTQEAALETTSLTI